MGFAVPLSDWLRGPLKDWAWDLINQRKLNDGLINVPMVKKIFDATKGPITRTYFRRKC